MNTSSLLAVMEDTQEQHKRIDRLAICVSVLCLLHCILTPFVAILFPILSFHNETWLSHALLSVFVVGLGVPAFRKGYKHHHKILPAILGFSGMLLILGSFFTTELEAHHQHTEWHVIMTVIGSAILVMGHYLNIRTCRCKEG